MKSDMLRGQQEMASIHQQIVFLLVFIVPNSASHASTCPSSCKCTAADASKDKLEQSFDKSQVHLQTVGSPMASCWIPSDLAQLQCAVDWDILHLQVLSGPHGSRRGTASEAASHPIAISSDLFVKCGSITRLAIWEHSQFTIMPRYILRPLINLTRLIIQVRSLRMIPDHFVAFLPRLNFVMISKCRQLHEIGRLVFEPCPKSLQTLWLNSNRLSGKLPAGIFHQCNLKTLWLNDNQLEMLDWGSLQGLGNLTSLRLDQNKLRNSLEQSLGYRGDTRTTALRSTPMLKSLDLSSNQLSSIEGTQWSGRCERSGINTEGLCFLEELNLSNNQMQWLDPYSFQGLPALRILRLEGNFQLYSPDASNGLLITLYVMGITNKRLTSVTINTVNDRDRSFPPNVIDMCDRDIKFMQTIPRPLRRILTYFNESNCAQQIGVLDEDSSTEVLHGEQRNRASFFPDREESKTITSANRTHKEANALVRLVRRADGLTVFLLCLCLLICGMLLSVVPFVLVACYYFKDYGDNRRRCASKNYTKQKPFVWAQSAPYTSCLSVQHTGIPLHEQADALPVSLQSTRSLLQSGNTVNQMYFSPQHMRGPVPGHLERVDMCHERRVNSTGNVYHQIGHKRFQQANPQLINGDLITRHLHQDRQPNLLPFETRPLLQSSIGTATGSMYMPAAENSMGGSAYSLVTLTSKQALSPVTPRRMIAVPIRTG